MLRIDEILDPESDGSMACDVVCASVIAGHKWRSVTAQQKLVVLTDCLRVHISGGE